MRLSLLHLYVPGLALVVLSGCCPIPVPRTATVYPEIRATVTDADSGVPISESTVFVQRVHLGPPPTEILGHTEAITDPGGKARLAAVSEREFVMPLMMHGVPHRGWRICISHPDYETVLPADNRIEGSPELDEIWTIEVELHSGETTACDELLEEPGIW